VHDETRSCIFDMTGIKTEIIYSASKPTVCDKCSILLQERKIANNIIEKVKAELKGIRKTTYYRLLDFIKRWPILTIILSSSLAILLGIISSYLFEMIKPFIITTH